MCLLWLSVVSKCAQRPAQSERDSPASTLPQPPDDSVTPALVQLLPGSGYPWRPSYKHGPAPAVAARLECFHPVAKHAVFQGLARCHVGDERTLSRFVRLDVTSLLQMAPDPGRARSDSISCCKPNDRQTPFANNCLASAAERERNLHPKSTCVHGMREWRRRWDWAIAPCCCSTRRSKRARTRCPAHRRIRPAARSACASERDTTR